MLRMSAVTSFGFSFPPFFFGRIHSCQAFGQSLTSNFQFITHQSPYHSSLQAFDIDSVVK